jgi:sec-independent protein translocase protein TatA
MSTGEIVLILFVYLLLFGAKGLPSVAQTMGKAIYQFRNAARDVQNEIMQSADEIRKEAERSVKLDQLDALREDMNQKKAAQPAQKIAGDQEEHPQV